MERGYKWKEDTKDEGLITMNEPTGEKSMTTYVGLFRGINVGGHRVIAMEKLRSLCSSVGLQDVRSYLQSGNIVFQASANPLALEESLERCIGDYFGEPVTVIVRPMIHWRSYVDVNPFRKQAEKEPNQVMLVLSKDLPRVDAAEALQSHAHRGETVEQMDDLIWIYFPEGVSRSKITPSVLDQSIGSPATMRNWRTVVKLAHL